MNDIEKAIETLKDMKGVFDTRGHKQYSLPALDLAIASLEKQIPKKALKLKYEPLINAGWRFECPTCHVAVGKNKYHPEVTDSEAYCTDCGQHIDWSVEE